jgi:hypothetical protein
MQQVENFRPDVRVVNLSLLNTDWYIEQLRDDPPKLPVHLSDAEVRSLGMGYVADSTGRPLYYTNEFMVRHLVETSRQPQGKWIKQPYFAVTVPEQMGYTPYFSLEALCYRINPDSTSNPRLDVERTRHNLYDEFKYRGLFLADGAWDTLVYKDENASTLSRNYAAAHLQLAFHYRKSGRLDLAIAEMQRVERMFPDWVEAVMPLGSFYLDHGDTAKAVDFFERLSMRSPNNPEVRYYTGVALVFSGKLERGMHEFDTAIGLDPSYGQAFYAAYYAARQSGQRERALGYLQRWVDNHPEDSQAMQLLQMERGGASKGPPVPPPATTPILP